MNTIAFEAKKAEAAKLILLENNEEVVDEIISYFKKLKQSKSTCPPCQLTVDELKAEVENGISQHKNGQTKTQKEVFDNIEKLLAE